MSDVVGRGAVSRTPRNPEELDTDPLAAADAVKRTALALGADFVGIGNIERWAGAPRQMDPLQFMPECRSVVCCGFRVMRGSLRGVEEGTLFSNYSAMGYGGITHIYMPITITNVAKYIEDHGYEAIPYGQMDNWRSVGNTGWMRPRHSRPVAEGRAAPDVSPHSRIAAFLCGCGEIGMSKMFLSPQFGPRCRIGLVFTDAVLAPDPIYDGPELCNKCGACARECPGQCFDTEHTVKVNLAGHEVAWYDIDCYKCDVTFRGGEWAGEDLPKDEEYMPRMWNHEAQAALKVRRGPNSPFYKKPDNIYYTGQAVCGAAGCTRACMMSLEARGVVGNSFKEKFRRRKPWRVDWSTPAPDVEQPVSDWKPLPGTEVD